MNKEAIAESFRKLQDHICRRLEQVDGTSSFQEDNWEREQGGGGRTRIISNGNIIEKGGVNFSEVYGPVTEMMRSNTEIDAADFFATGVSIVLHPNTPHIPIIHMNVRYFELSNGKYWFGGGIDLTPHYIVPSQAGDFHRSLKEVCDKYDRQFYPKFKQWADDYFYLPHRDETRGVGGIFYDHLSASSSISKDELLKFSIDLGELFPEVYEHQVKLGKAKEVLRHEKDWMNLRRGRYVEFNLVNDRGTKFGLVSGGRAESILMSLPPNATWEYMHSAKDDSPELSTLMQLRKNIDWVGK